MTPIRDKYYRITFSKLGILGYQVSLWLRPALYNMHNVLVSMRGGGDGGVAAPVPPFLRFYPLPMN